MEQARRDVGLAADPEMPASEPVPHRHVERYLAAPVSEELGKAFEEFLSAHPEMDEGIEKVFLQLVDDGRSARSVLFLNLLQRAKRGIEIPDHGCNPALLVLIVNVGLQADPACGDFGRRARAAG